MNGAARVGAGLRSALFAALFYPASLFFVLTAMAVAPVSHRALLSVAAGWSCFHRMLVRIILRIDVVVEGERPTGQVLYALRHESFFEALDLPCFLGDYPVPFAKIELTRIPLWGRIAQRYGVVPVDRAGGASTLRAMRRAAIAARHTGRNFALFPEGTRVDPGTAPAMQSGLYGIYRMLDLPVVPVAVDSAQAYPAKRAGRATITYRIGPAIPVGLPRDVLENRVRTAINALNPMFAG